ncbi:hypothetical protein AAG906_009648 [Vitis piasezkii]
MKLNPVKCAFGVSVGKFLGLTQVKSILETPAQNRKKELQCLTDRLMALDKCMQTFEAIKRYLIEPPILSSPKSGEELYIADCSNTEECHLKAPPILPYSSSDRTYKPAYSERTLEKNEKADTLPEIVVFLPINGMVILPIYLKVMSSITPGPVCNIDQTDSG